MTIHIHEFLYRGAIPEEKREAAFHVVLADEVEAFGEKKLQLRGPMTLEKATADYGMSLTAILGELLSQAAVDREAAIASRDAANTTRDEALAEKSKVTTALTKLVKLAGVGDEAIEAHGLVAMADGLVEVVTAAVKQKG